MIENKWRKQLAKAGISQAEFSKKSGVYPAMVSHIISGAAAPITKAGADRMCNVLGCDISDVYSSEVIRVLYGEVGNEKSVKQRKIDTRVRLAAGVWERLTERARELGMDASQYANHLLMGRLGIDDDT